MTATVIARRRRQSDYGPAETLLADLATAYPEAEFEALTKWVPRGGEMTREVVEDAIRVSLGRMVCCSCSCFSVGGVVSVPVSALRRWLCC